MSCAVNEAVGSGWTAIGVAVGSLIGVDVKVGKGTTVAVGAGAGSVLRQPVAVKPRSASSSHASNPNRRRLERIHRAAWGANGWAEK